MAAKKDKKKNTEDQEEMAEIGKKQEKKVKPRTVILAVLVLAAAYLLIIGIMLYGFGSSGNLVKKTADIIPYPAAIVNGSAIKISDVQRRTASVQNFYENQDFSDLGLRVDFNTPDGQKRLQIKEKNILEKMIEDSLIEKEARKRGIDITPDILSQEVERKMGEYSSQDYLKDNLKKLYGWTIEDFKENIVKPDLYKEKLFEYLKQNDTSFSEAKSKIEKAQEELKNRKAFEDVAKEYSEGESANDGGDLGWYDATQMLPEISQAAFSLDKGKQSEIIQSAIGYHIIKITDKKNQDGVDIVRVSQIFVRTMTLPEWLDNAEENAKIHVFLKGMYWDKESNGLEFKDETMKNFEENLDQNSQNDASVMF